jgi:hypothetical protein
MSVRRENSEIVMTRSAIRVEPGKCSARVYRSAGVKNSG